MSAVGEPSVAVAAAASWPLAVKARTPDRRRRCALETRLVRIGLLGYGRVGQAIAELAARPAVQARLRSHGLRVQCVGALVRDLDKPRHGPALPLVSSFPARSADVIVEVLGGIEPARALVTQALRARVPVVTANKSLVAAHGAELRALARQHRTGFAYDAAVLAGVPFLGSLSRRPLVSAARRFTGILNGTSHFVACAVARGASFPRALAEAVERGYAEPDSVADTSGRDAAEKLAILLHLAGYDVVAQDIPRAPLNVLTPELVSGAKRLGGAIKPVAIAELDPQRSGAWVGPAFVPFDHPLARLDGVANALQLTNSSGETLTFAGPGAGPEATALTVLDDVVELHEMAASLDGSRSADRPHGPSRWRGARASLRSPPKSAWFLEIRSPRANDSREVATRLNTLGVPPLQVCAHAGRVIARTVPVSWDAMQAAANALRAGGADAVGLPSLE